MNAHTPDMEQQPSNDMAQFRALIANFEQSIDDLDGATSGLDAQIASLQLEIQGLQAMKQNNLDLRATRVMKLAGIRRLLRELEDAQTLAARAREDAEY